MAQAKIVASLDLVVDGLTRRSTVAGNNAEEVIDFVEYRIRNLTCNVEAATVVVDSEVERTDILAYWLNRAAVQGEIRSVVVEEAFDLSFKDPCCSKCVYSSLTSDNVMICRKLLIKFPCALLDSGEFSKIEDVPSKLLRNEVVWFVERSKPDGFCGTAGKKFEMKE